MEARVTSEDNLALTASVTNGEIKEETMGEDVVNIVKAFWHSGTLLWKLNHTNLVLIPKVKCLKNMTQYRPIALCNVIYKIIAKVLTNRLKKVMPKVISDNQSTFVARKQTRRIF
ncbi:hypothetical protein ACFXTH_032590 [Malus domestica]